MPHALLHLRNIAEVRAELAGFSWPLCAPMVSGCCKPLGMGSGLCDETWQAQRLLIKSCLRCFGKEIVMGSHVLHQLVTICLSHVWLHSASAGPHY